LNWSTGKIGRIYLGTLSHHERQQLGRCDESVP